MAQGSNLLYQRYRSIALAVYVCVLFAGLIDWLDGGLGPRSIISAPDSLRFFAFTITVLALIGLELWTLVNGNNFPTGKKNFFLFCVRLALFSGACLVTDLHYSKILFLPILLYGYFTVSQRLSYVIALLGVAILFIFSAANIGGIRPSPPLGVSKLGGLIDRSTGSLIALLFTLLLAQAMSQAIQAQQKLTHLLQSLESSHRQLQGYASRVADLATTEERNRLARDIHDSLGHHLAAINIQLEKASAYRERDPDRAYEAVKHAQETVQDALKDVRASVSSLRQEGTPFSFHASLDELIRRMDHNDLDITLNQAGESKNYTKLKLMTLYRVLQEGLTNIHKHAHASQAHINLNFGPQHITLELMDNGLGFDVTAWKLQDTQQTTHGLIGLQERLSLVGGTLDITSQPQATTLAISIPLDPPQISYQAE